MPFCKFPSNPNPLLSSTRSIPNGSIQDLTDIRSNGMGDRSVRKVKRGSKDKRVSEEISQTGEAGRTTFELFRTYDGEEYTVYMRDDGKRFYVDFEEQV